MAFSSAAHPLNPTLVNRVFNSLHEFGNFLFPFDLKIVSRTFVIVPKGVVWQVYTTAGGVRRFEDEVSLRLRVDFSSHEFLCEEDTKVMTVKYDDRLLLDHVLTGRAVFSMRNAERYSIAAVLMKIALRFSQCICCDLNLCLNEINVCHRDNWDPFKKLSETDFYADRIGICPELEARIQELHPWTRWPAGALIDPGLLELGWTITYALPIVCFNQSALRSQVYKFYRCGTCLDTGCDRCYGDAVQLPPPALEVVRADDIDIIWSKLYRGESLASFVDKRVIEFSIQKGSRRGSECPRSSQ